MTSKIKLIVLGSLFSLIYAGVVNWFLAQYLLITPMSYKPRSSMATNWTQVTLANDGQTRFQTLGRSSNESRLTGRGIVDMVLQALDLKHPVVRKGELGMDVQRIYLPKKYGNDTDQFQERMVLDENESYPRNHESVPVNPHGFKLVINQPNHCNTNRLPDPVFLMVLMLSSAGNFRQRQIQRKSCLSVTRARGRNIRHVFLLGDSGSDEIAKKVRKEAEVFNDILMEDFRDSYRNLTLKTLMGMKWASIYCSQAVFVMKTDDDVYISMPNIVEFLIDNVQRNLFTGFLFQKTKPIRDKTDKWYLPKGEYSRDWFPPYCSGTGYILSGDLTSRIFTASLSIPYISMEDVFVGLCLEKLGVEPSQSHGFFQAPQPYDYCSFKKSLVVHSQRPVKIGQDWQDQQGNTANVTC